MACQCGASTVAEADETGAGTCGCGSGAAEGSPESLDVAALARLVKDLDQRVRELELETSRS